MGLAGRKQKQRIPADPRNLSWADDASRFGLSYLSKFGWDASQGLGSSGDGIKTPLKVQQKLDMMGIGAQHQRDPNGIAWKQNKEFEALLKRLNESSEREKGADSEEAELESGRVSEMAIGSKTFVGAQEEEAEEKFRDESLSSVTIKKKRKHKDTDDPDTSENTRKKQKKEKKYRKSSFDIPAVSAIAPSPDPPSVPPSSGPHSGPMSKPRPMAHRARIRAAKRITGKSASAISEILGIAPSSSVSASTSTPAPTPPFSSTPQPSSLSLDNLTTSVKSVADYFKDKLLARPIASSASFSSAPSGSATPDLGTTRAGIGMTTQDDESDPPRRGIGSRVLIIAPPSQVPDSVSAPASGDGGGNADGLTEKLRQKAERKAEKRKRREADANQPIPESVSTIVKEQVEKDDAEGVQRMPKKEKKKGREERKQQAPAADQPILTTIIPSPRKSHEYGTSSDSLPEPSKKSKKAHAKKRS